MAKEMQCLFPDEVALPGKAGVVAIPSLRYVKRDPVTADWSTRLIGGLREDYLARNCSRPLGAKSSL